MALAQGWVRKEKSGYQMLRPKPIISKNSHTFDHVSHQRVQTEVYDEDDEAEDVSWT